MKSLVQCFWVLFFFAVGELIGMMIGHFLPGSVIGLILSMVVSTALVLVVVGRMQHRFERHHKGQIPNDNA